MWKESGLSSGEAEEPTPPTAGAPGLPLHLSTCFPASSPPRPLSAEKTTQAPYSPSHRAPKSSVIDLRRSFKKETSTAVLYSPAVRGPSEQAVGKVSCSGFRRGSPSTTPPSCSPACPLAQSRHAPTRLCTSSFLRRTAARLGGASVRGFQARRDSSLFDVYQVQGRSPTRTSAFHDVTERNAGGSGVGTPTARSRAAKPRGLEGSATL